jgi:hypothetical protein
VVVDHEQLLHTCLHEPRGNRPRTDAVVRHHSHERRTAQSHEGRKRRDLEQSRLREDWRALEHLGRVEVANVGDRVRVIRRSPCVRDSLLVPIGAEAVECNQLYPVGVTLLERELHPAQHVSPALGEWTAERKAGVDAAQGASGSTSREPVRPNRSV